jgi:hypothetical protein
MITEAGINLRICISGKMPILFIESWSDKLLKDNAPGGKNLADCRLCVFHRMREPEDGWLVKVLSQDLHTDGQTIF